MKICKDKSSNHGGAQIIPGRLYETFSKTHSPRLRLCILQRDGKLAMVDLEKGDISNNAVGDFEWQYRDVTDEYVIKKGEC